MTLTHSEAINELATALAKAQAEMEGAAKSAINPHYRHSYADLASVWDAVRGPLTSNGIAVVQAPTTDGTQVSVETLMLHTSGQWMRGVLTVAAADDKAQTIGSAITYLRRYTLQSMAGVAPEDDDAEGAEGRKAPRGFPPLVVKPPANYEEWLVKFEAAAAKGLPSMRQAYKDASQEHRDHLTRFDADRLNRLELTAKRATPGQPRLVAEPEQP